MGTRALTGTVGTILVGTLIGFFVASAVGILVQDSGVLGGNGESPVARAYMLGLLQRDPNSISSIRPQQGIAQRAAELQGAWGRSPCRSTRWLSAARPGSISSFRSR